MSCIANCEGHIVKSASVKRSGTSKPIAPAPNMDKRHFDSKAFLTSVGNGRSSMKYRPKETVFRQGAAADAVYYIQTGKIQISVVSKQGKEAIIARLGPGEFFGEGCLAGQALHIASAAAIGASTVARIEKDTMIRVLREQPNLAETFMAFLLSRNIQVEADLVDQLFNSSERRLARLLLLLANFGKEGKLDTVIPKISQDTLASQVGTTRARINFFMNKFRKLGFVEYDGDSESNGDGLKVHSSLLNVIVHD